MTPEQTKVAKYLTSGAVAAVANFGTLGSLIKILKFYPTPSSAIAFAVGAVINYLMQYYWTFRADQRHFRALLIYCFVMACTICINTAIFWVLNDLLGVWYLLAQLLALGLVVPFTYSIHKHYTFT